MSAAGDITQPEVMRDVCMALFRPTGGPALRSLMDAHFDDSIVMTNPYFSFKGKENLYHLFHLWQTIFDDRLEVLSVATRGNKVLVKNRHNVIIRPVHLVKHVLPKFMTDLINMPIILNIEVETVSTATGTKIISMKEDVSLYTLILNLFWPAKLLPVWSWFETAVGQGAVIADQIGVQAYHILNPILGPYADWAVRNTDKLIKDMTGVDTGLARAQKHFWA